MKAKLPPEAFSYYMGLGPDRTYQAVADHYGVAKRTVAGLATRDGWQDRVARLEQEAKQKAEQRTLESLEDMNVRHLKSLRVIQGKALEALRSMPLESAMDAIRALDIGIKHERVVRGEPSERTAHSVEDVIRREYDRWMTTNETKACDDDA